MAESRGMTYDEIDAVARGRVWTGVDAHERGLVDVLGGIDRAIELAAEKAGIDSYTLDSYPKQKDIFQELFASGNARLNAFMFSFLPEPLKQQETQDLMKLMKQPKGSNWALLPLRFEIN